MAANMFSRLERFREESLAQIDNHESLSHSLTQSVRYVGIELLGQLKMRKEKDERSIGF